MPELVIAPAEFLCGNATPQLIIASSMLLAIRTTLALGKIGVRVHVTEDYLKTMIFMHSYKKAERGGELTLCRPLLRGKVE
jgi:hypothetical protein